MNFGHRAHKERFSSIHGLRLRPGVVDAVSKNRSVMVGQGITTGADRSERAETRHNTITVRK